MAKIPEINNLPFTDLPGSKYYTVRDNDGNMTVKTDSQLTENERNVLANGGVGFGFYL